MDYRGQSPWELPWVPTITTADTSLPKPSPEARISALEHELQILINAPPSADGSFNAKRVEWLKARARAALGYI